MATKPTKSASGAIPERRSRPSTISEVLNTLIGRALKNNPTILAAEEALKRAKAFLERRDARVSVFERAGIGAEAVDRWVRRSFSTHNKVKPPRRKPRSGVRAGTANEAEARKSGGKQDQSRRFGDPFHQ